MMKKIMCCLLLALMFACRQADEKPGDILSHDQMVKVLTDVYLAEQKVAGLSLGVDSSQEVFAMMETKVFEQTGVPDSIFKKSMNYYMEHPKELEQIYGVLVDSLQLREQRSMP